MLVYTCNLSSLEVGTQAEGSGNPEPSLAIQPVQSQPGVYETLAPVSKRMRVKI